MDLRVTFLDASGREIGCIDTGTRYSQRAIAAFKRSAKDPLTARDYTMPGAKGMRFEAI